jgi:hypothetical protein
MTRRIVLDTEISIDSEKRIAAELALDRVSYLVDECTVLHYELEVEAKAPEYLAAVVDLTDLIKQKFGDRPKRWDHNKLATGFALGRPHEQGKIMMHPGEAILLDANAYETLDTFLKNSRRQA